MPLFVKEVEWMDNFLGHRELRMTFVIPDSLLFYPAASKMLKHMVNPANHCWDSDTVMALAQLLFEVEHEAAEANKKKAPKTITVGDVFHYYGDKVVPGQTYHIKDPAPHLNGGAKPLTPMVVGPDLVGKMPVSNYTTYTVVANPYTVVPPGGLSGDFHAFLKDMLTKPDHIHKIDKLIFQKAGKKP